MIDSAARVKLGFAPMAQTRVPPGALYPPPLEGHGLALRPWDADLVEQMGRWGQRGFPYHPFDLGYLRDAANARAALARAHSPGPHRHFVAVEGGAAVGRVSVNLRDAAGLYLWAVHVPPEQAGRGVARRMLATLMEWLELEYPRTAFVLTANTFAAPAHRAYFSLGFTIAETRWHFDREIADELWKVDAARRAPVMDHLRFAGGQWQVRTYLMRREPGTAMRVRFDG